MSDVELSQKLSCKRKLVLLIVVLTVSFPSSLRVTDSDTVVNAYGMTHRSAEQPYRMVVTANTRGMWILAARYPTNNVSNIYPMSLHAKRNPLLVLLIPNCLSRAVI